MKKVLFAGVAALVLAGCSTSPYFVKKQGNKLSFYAQIPKAKSVYFVSNVTNFKKVKAVEVQNGLWRVYVPYRKGIVKYFYLVNGHIFVPPCKVRQRDGFGGEDCVYIPSSM